MGAAERQSSADAQNPNGASPTSHRHNGNADQPPSPLLVVGCPRSGTTAVGTYLGTSNRVCDMGEYAGLHFAWERAPAIFATMPGRFRDAYCAGLREHAVEFARSAALAESAAYFLDYVPGISSSQKNCPKTCPTRDLCCSCAIPRQWSRASAGPSEMGTPGQVRTTRRGREYGSTSTERRSDCPSTALSPFPTIA